MSFENNYLNSGDDTMNLSELPRTTVIVTCLLSGLLAGCSTNKTTRNSPKSYDFCGSDIMICRGAKGSRFVHSDNPFTICRCSSIGDITT